jgi:hypothetical protein
LLNLFKITPNPDQIHDGNEDEPVVVSEAAEEDKGDTAA